MKVWKTCGTGSFEGLGKSCCHTSVASAVFLGPDRQSDLPHWHPRQTLSQSRLGRAALCSRHCHAQGQIVIGGLIQEKVQQMLSIGSGQVRIPVVSTESRICVSCASVCALGREKACRRPRPRHQRQRQSFLPCTQVRCGQGKASFPVTWAMAPPC